MLPSYFDYIFEHLRQKVRLRPQIKFTILSTLGPNQARTRPEPDLVPNARPDLQLWTKMPVYSQHL